MLAVRKISTSLKIKSFSERDLTKLDDQYPQQSKRRRAATGGNACHRSQSVKVRLEIEGIEARL